MIRTVLADDHPIVRAGMIEMLSQTEDIEVIAQADNGVSALNYALELEPDILLLDMELPEMDGIEVTEALQKKQTSTRVLALSAYNSSSYILGVIEHGAMGYLTKDEGADTILQAIRHVARGGTWMSPEIKMRIQQARQEKNNAEVNQLSSRELQVFQLIAEGCDNLTICSTLDISEGTVKNHVTNIYNKLHLHNRAEAVAWAWRNGVIS